MNASQNFTNLVIVTSPLLFTVINHLLFESKTSDRDPRCIDRAITRSIHQGRGLTFPRNDRSDEIIKLYIIWPFHYGPEPAID